MTTTTASDSARAIAEHQLVLLGELTEIAMAVSRAIGSSVIASAKAAETILADEYFMPEVGRARACGVKDATEAFHKAARAARLTAMLRMRIATWLRDGAPEDPDYPWDVTDRPRLADSSPRLRADAETVDRLRAEAPAAERLPSARQDAEPLDILPCAPFRDTVEGLCADVGATMDWARWSATAPSRTAARSGARAPKPPPQPPSKASPDRQTGGRGSAPPDRSDSSG